MKQHDVVGVAAGLIVHAMPLPGHLLPDGFGLGRPHPILLLAVRRVSRNPTVRIIWPLMYGSPSTYAFFNRSSKGSIPSRAAMMSICASEAQVACGVPKPGCAA